MSDCYEDTPEEIGRSNAVMGWDQRFSYPTPRDAFQEYFLNVVDSLSEHKRWTPSEKKKAFVVFIATWKDLGGTPF